MCKFRIDWIPILCVALLLYVCTMMLNNIGIFDFTCFNVAEFADIDFIGSDPGL
jgi:hypothetical protein